MAQDVCTVTLPSTIPLRVTNFAFLVTQYGSVNGVLQ